MYKKVIKINPNLYPLEAILSACYPFTDRVYIFLDGNPKKQIFVTLKNKGRDSRKKLASLVRDFKNSLIHYALRAKISKENKKIREYIICRALYSEFPDFTDTEHLGSHVTDTSIKKKTKRIVKQKK